MSPMPVSVPVASARKIRTKGSASPSLTPDSMLSSRRSRSGTSVRPTMAEAKTGSVGERMAPTSSDGGPVEADEVVGGDRDEQQRQRHAQPEGAAGQPPAGAQLAQRQSAAVDEQDGEQGEVGEPAHQRSLGGYLDQPEEPGSDERPGDQEHQCGRQHRPGRQPGEGDRDQQHNAEGQDQDHAALPSLRLSATTDVTGGRRSPLPRRRSGASAPPKFPGGGAVPRRRPLRSRSGSAARPIRGTSGYAAVAFRTTRTRSGSGTCGPLGDDGELATGFVENVADVAEPVHSVAPQVGQHLALDQAASAYA